MGRRRTERIIRSINMDSARMDDGKIQTKITLTFKGGQQYAESSQGLKGRFEGLCVGDKVLTTTIGETIIQVLIA